MGNQMKPEDQRIAFLEYLGWTNLNRDSKLGNYRALRGTSPEGKKDQIAPNPLVDLNIIYNVYNISETALQTLWYINLLNVVKSRCCVNINRDSLKILAINAKPTERLEAFLKTVDRWKE